MKKIRFLVGALLMFSAAAASAATVTKTFTIDLENTSVFGNRVNASAGTNFMDTYNFSLSAREGLGASLTSKAVGASDLNITSFALYSGNNLIATGTQQSTGPLDSWSLLTPDLKSGDYSLKVGGQVIGTARASYAIDANVSPVPEPEAWSMVAAGLVAVGLIGRRSKSKSLLLNTASA